MQIIRPGDRLIIGWKQIDNLVACAECNHAECHGARVAMKADVDSFEASGEYWQTLLPGVNIVWMCEPHFENYQIIAIYRPDPQPKEAEGPPRKRRIKWDEADIRANYLPVEDDRPPTTVIYEAA